MSLNIREATRDDFAEILNIVSIDETVDYLPSLLGQWLGENDRLNAVCLINDKIVGFCSFSKYQAGSEDTVRFNSVFNEFFK